MRDVCNFYKSVYLKAKGLDVDKTPGANKLRSLIRIILMLYTLRVYYTTTDSDYTFWLKKRSMILLLFLMREYL